MRKEFIPRPGAFGTHPVVLSKDISTTALTANTTNTRSIGGINRAAFVERISVSVRTVPADADGTLLITVKKRDASAAANVTLTGTTFNLESLTANASTAIPLLTTLTDAQRTCDEGDTIFVEVVSNSAAIDTQPVDCVVTVILGLLK
jgi:hypothetical protein